jgi:hypothetical protein
MADAKDAEPNPPRTLVEAHEALAQIRPPRKAPLGQWLSYYQRSAAMYAEIAEIDRGHHHESLYWAEHARNHAQEIKARISDQRTAAINEERGEEGGENTDGRSATDVDASP